MSSHATQPVRRLARWKSGREGPRPSIGENQHLWMCQKSTAGQASSRTLRFPMPYQSHPARGTASLSRDKHSTPLTITDTDRSARQGGVNIGDLSNIDSLNSTSDFIQDRNQNRKRLNAANKHCWASQQWHPAIPVISGTLRIPMAYQLSGQSYRVMGSPLAEYFTRLLYPACLRQALPLTQTFRNPTDLTIVAHLRDLPKKRFQINRRIPSEAQLMRVAAVPLTASQPCLLEASIRKSRENSEAQNKCCEKRHLAGW